MWRVLAGVAACAWAQQPGVHVEDGLDAHVAAVGRIAAMLLDGQLPRLSTECSSG